MKKLVRIFAIVFVISVLLLAVSACKTDCNGNHTWSSGNVTKEATCTEVGEITFVCLECGEIRVTTIDKLEHSWNDGVVTKEPTCTSVGEKTFECALCHATKTEELAFCQHTYSWQEEVSATCTEKGVAAHFVCTVCGGLFDENKVATTQQALEISASHVFGEKTVVTEATCADEGLAKQICTLCEHEETFVIPKTEQHVVVVDSAVSATCTQTGLTEGSHCEVCGTVIVAQKVVPVTAHSWSAWATTQPATCTETGVQQRECSVCGKTETGEIAKLNHAYQIQVVAPSCTEGGYTLHKCTRCGDSFTDSETAALQHNYVATVKAPTCTEGGYTTHECTRCGDSFTDSETAALQHNYVATVKAPTCTEGGYTTHECTRCGDSFTDSETPALGHTESGWIVDKAPTCLATGLRHVECTVCHQTIRTEEIATTAHTFGENQTFKPTCSADGYTFHTCQVCGLVEKFDIVPAAHRVVVDQAVEPTCTKTGLTEGSHCSFCGTVLVAQQVVAKVAHTEVADNAVAPTCSSTGLTEGSHCEVCGEILVAQQIVEKLAHTAVTDVAVPATCTTTGLTEGSHCSVCGEVIVAQQVVEKLVHTAVTDVAVAATCTESGLTEGSHCSVCNTVIVAQQVVPATGHTAVTDVAVPATCTESGLAEGSHCSVCNEILVAQTVIPANGHTEVVDSAVAPTCTATGLTEGKHCSVCGEVIVEQQVVGKLPHTEVIDAAVPATCTATGLTEGSHCSVCGEILVAQQIEEKLAHTAITDSAVAPTCTEDGLTEGSHCEVCGEVIVAQQAVPATGHAWGSWRTTTQATCTQSGEKERVCSVCGETETQRILPMGHTQIQLVGTPATCTQNGISNGVICAVCNTIIVAQQTLPALGHSWQDGYTTNDAQHWKVCTREGCDEISELANHDHSLFCTVCGWVSELANFKFEAGESYAYFQTLSDVLAVVPTDNTPVTVTLLKDASGSGATIAEGTNINWNLANHTYTVTDGGSSLFAVRKAPRAITVAFTLEEGSVLTIVNGTISLGATSANVLFVQNNTLTLQNVTLDASTSTAETTTALSVHIGTTNILENVTLVSKNGEAQGIALEMMYSKANTEICVAWNADNAPTMDGQIIYGCKTAVYQDDWVKKVVFMVGDENGTVSYSVGSATAVTPDNESVSFDGLDSLLEDKTMVGEVHTHNWNDGETTLAPTCTQTGVYTYTCTGCDATKTTVLPALDHNYNAVVTAPTCTEKGYTTHTCSRCADSYVDTYVDALEHAWGEWEVTTPATCTEKGEETRICEHDNSHKETRELAIIAHTPETAVEENRVEATCTADGSYDSVVYCSVCHAELSRTEMAIPAIGHEWGEWKVTTPATCTEKGEETRICGNDNSHKETREVAALNHALVHHDAKAPTCTAIGWEAYDTCSRCDYTTYVEKPATGHTPATAVEENRVEATCTADGSYDSVVYCSVCHAELSRTEMAIPAIGHAWGEWEVTAPATCTEKGEETRICGNDNRHKETRELAIIAHTPETAVEENRVEATCLDGGSYDSVVYCSVCHAELSRTHETLTALGHDLVHHDAKAPTCTAIGWEAYDTCSRCDYTTYAEKSATGHTAATAVEENRAEATCTEDGSYDSVVYCSVCHAELSRTEMAIPAIGHAWGEWEVTTHATCTEKGEETRICGNDANHKETKEVAALNHDYNSVVTAPTCTEKGYTTHTCSRCGDSYTDSYVDAAGHSYGDWTEVDETQHKHVCTVCSDEETASHNYGNWVTDDVKGGHSRACSDCSATQNQAHTWNGDVCSVCDCAKYENAWKLVTDASTLKAGDQIVIASNDKGFVAGAISSQVMTNIPATFAEDKSTLTLPDDAVILTLGGTPGAWTLASPSGQLLGATAVKKLAWDSGTTTWSISIANNDATIQNGTSSNGKLLYNSNSSGLRFTTYTSDPSDAMLLPQIYKHVEICRAHEAGGTWIVDGENHWHVCNTCGKVVGEKVAHTLNSVAEISSDCKTQGTKAHFKCEICNTLILEVESVKTVVTAEDLELPLAAHTLGEWHEGSATCTEAGTIGHYQCSVCLKYFDIDGTTELKSIDVDAPGHSFSAEWTSDGTNHWHKCIRCDATQDSAAHTFAFASDETQHWQVCSVCNHETAKEKHTYVDGDCQCGATIKGTQKYPYTVAEALAEAAKLAQGEYSATKVYVVGTINSIGSSVGYLSNVKLGDTADRATEILLYSCNLSENVPVVYVNDTIVVCAYITNYKGTLELSGKGQDYPSAESRIAGTSEITFEANENAQIVLGATSGINGETFSFTVTANSGYVVTTVTVNGSVVTPVDGTYSAIVEGPTTITVETTVLGGVVVSTWNLVTDASTLKAGDQIVIASNSEGFVAGAISSQVMTNISATFAEDKSTLTLPDDAVILTLGGAQGAWTLASPSGQLLGATAVKKLAWDKGTTTWSITISDNNATIQNGTDTYGRFLYNATSGQERFTTYTSKTNVSMLLPQIYKLNEFTCVEHNYGEEIAEVPATCGTAGVKAHYKCSICQGLFIDVDSVKTLVQQSDLQIPTTGHTYTPVSGTPATCTSEGTEAHYKCSVCEKLFLEEGGAEVTASDLVIPTTDHTYNSVAEVSATCTKEGTKAHYKCSVCDKLFLEEGGVEVTAESLVLPMSSHNVTTWTSNGSGKHSGTCTMCHDTFEEYCNKDGTDEACSKCGFVSNLISIELTNKSNSTVTWYKQDGDSYVLLGTGITNLPPSCNYAITVNLDGATSFAVTLGGTPVETKTDATLGTLYLIPVATEDISVNVTATFTVTMTSFSAVSDTMDGNISYTSEKGGGTSAPAINGSVIRIYQIKSGNFGGKITINTINTGVVIKSVTIGSSMATKIAYSIDSNSSPTSDSEELAANGTHTYSNLTCSSVTVYCMGNSSSSRLYVNYLQVVYEI